MAGGLSRMLGMSSSSSEDEEGGDAEREAAKAALKRFRSTKDDDEALEAFMSLCRYAKGSMGGGETSDEVDEEEEY
jgi:hypothetical protein